MCKYSFIELFVVIHVELIFVSLQAVTAIRLVLNLHIAGHRREVRYGTEVSSSTRTTFLRYGHTRTFTPMTFAERRVLGDLGESLEPSSDDGAIELELGYLDESSATDDSGLSDLKDSASDETIDAKAERILETVENGIS